MVLYVLHIDPRKLADSSSIGVYSDSQADVLIPHVGESRHKYALVELGTVVSVCLDSLATSRNV